MFREKLILLIHYSAYRIHCWHAGNQSLSWGCVSDHPVASMPPGLFHLGVWWLMGSWSGGMPPQNILQNCSTFFGAFSTIYSQKYNLGCVSLRKSKIGFLNPKESENGFCVSLPNRSIQDILDQGGSNEPKNQL